MSRRAPSSRGPIGEYFALYLRWPVRGPLLATAVLVAMFGWVGPSLLRATAPVPRSPGDPAAVTHAGVSGIADGLQQLVPWVIILLVAVPAVAAWTTLAVRRVRR